jgi:hypothetical protein
VHHVGHLPRITMKVTFFVHIFQMDLGTLTAGFSALTVCDVRDVMRKITQLSNKLVMEELQVCGSVTHLLLAVDYRQVAGIICRLSMYVKIYKFRQ